MRGTSATEQRVHFSSPSGAIVYEDSSDHFENGLLRLMNVTPSEFKRWLELAERHDGEPLDRLAAGWRELRPAPRSASVPPDGQIEPGPGGLNGRLWHSSIAESPAWGAALHTASMLAWLIRWDGERFARETRAPTYEQEYFEGDKLEAGGYGDYREQSAWRLEKSARQAREMHELTGLRAGRVLDIGCGYGYFRVALDEAGFEHDGLEVSGFARRIAKREYGFETFRGMLDDHWRSWTNRYDAITGFDLIEHVVDPVDFMLKVSSCLRPGGVVGLKTPNTDCPEAELFGPYYHSLKREHLWFFSAQSLASVAARAGLEPVATTTISHLLQGFVGSEQVKQWQLQGRGADLSVWFRKPARERAASAAQLTADASAIVE